MSEPVHEDGVTPVSQRDWDDLREANKVLTQSLREENAAAIKAMEERDTWRQRAEEAEEVVGDFQNKCERYDEFLESTLPADWSKRLAQAEAEAEDYGNALAAAERTVREQRDRAERAEGYIQSAAWDFTHGVPPDLIFVALSAAALATDTPKPTHHHCDEYDHTCPVPGCKSAALAPDTEEGTK